MKKYEVVDNKSVEYTTKKNNFNWINDEVDIVDSSSYISGFSPDIILGKSNSGPYLCTKGNRNHFIEFSFKNIYYLKSIRISVDDYECSLKNFKVETISTNGERNNIGTFKRSRYKDNTGFEEFQINKEWKGVKLYLIDNWGPEGGDYILIKRLDFNVSD